MPVSPATSRRLIVPAALLLLVASSLAPGRWHVYGPALRSFASMLLYPLTAPMQSANAWAAKDDPLPSLGKTDALSDKVRRLEGVMIAQEQENRRLKRMISELQGVRRALGDSYLFPDARVIGASSDAAAGTVQINLGTRDGVQPGMAVVDGESLALVGRIVQSGPTSSAVTSIASPGTLLEVVIAPPQLEGGKLEPQRQRTCLLEYESADLFIAANVDQAIVAKPGDLARLADYGGRIAWPNAVQGMVVGIVRQVEPDPDQPLRQKIHVEPIRSLRTRESVIVVVPRPAQEASTTGDKP